MADYQEGILMDSSVLTHTIMRIIKSLFKKSNIKYAVMAVVALLAIWFFFFRGSGKPVETITVAKGEFLQQVSSSGTVAAAQEVSIVVPQGGPVSSVFVKVGDHVEQGDRLLAIDTSALQANLLSAKADVALKKAEIKNKEVNIDKITQEQDTLVANARKTMLSDDLVAVPYADYDDLETPVITGRYGGDEGFYDIIIYKKNSDSTDYLLYTLGVENTAPIVILEHEPTPLGIKGLFISFPDALADYLTTRWKVEIPNKKSASYLENYNNYVKAIDLRNRAIADARENLEATSGTSILSAQLTKAEAEVQRILSDIAQRSIKAPFAGVVTKVEVKVGETASTSQVAVEMMSSGPFQIESFVPEIYIPLIKIGNEADVVLDAYGPEKIFKAKVISIDPAKTLRDGLPTYKILLELGSANEEVRNGMTANIVITTEKKENVISIPQGLVLNKNGKKIIRVREGGRVAEREVQTGGTSSFGQIEILSGLSEGEAVIVSQ